MRAWIATWGLMGLALDALACSCMSTPLSEKVENARFVGVVRVESTRLRPNFVKLIKQVELLKQEGREREVRLPILADFTPVEVVKGDVANINTLATGFGDGDCGVALVPGYDYLVIGSPESGELDIGLCSGSELLGQRSLVASQPDAARWARKQPRVAAIRRQIKDGVPIPTCLDNNPRFAPRETDECESDASDSSIQGRD